MGRDATADLNPLLDRGGEERCAGRFGDPRLLLCSGVSSFPKGRALR